MCADRSFFNIMILSWGFTLVFASFSTVCSIEKNVLDSVAKEDPNFKGDGYLSQCIIYASLALCNWLVPSFISMTGSRTSIIAGCLCFVFFIASFLWPRTDLLYVASGIVGLGAALAWTGQGHFVTINSDEATIIRNSGLFFSIFQLSNFPGSILVSFAFRDSEINRDTRNLVFMGLTLVSLVGVGLLLAMRKPPQSAAQTLKAPNEKSIFDAFRDSFILLSSRRILVLSLTSIFLGLQVGFSTSIYPSSVGFTKALGDGRKGLIGVLGIFYGLGGVAGGLVFGVLAPKCFGKATGLVVLGSGFTMYMIGYIVSWLNLPNNSPFTDTDDVGLIPASPVLVLVGSLALGLGDACLNTQIYSFLGTAYSNNSASAFALFIFCKSVASAANFFYSSYLGLNAQLIVLSCWLVLGIAAFCHVHVEYQREKLLTDCAANTFTKSKDQK